MPTDSHVILKVNEFGERIVFSLKSSEKPGYLCITYAQHYPVTHELSAVPTRYATEEGDIYLCTCGLRVVVPRLIKNKNSLYEIFKRYNQ